MLKYGHNAMNLTKRVSKPFSLMAKIRKTSSYI